MKRYLISALLAALQCLAAGAGAKTSWIEDLGGSVMRDAQGRVTGVDLRGTWVNDSDLRQLTHLPDLSYLNLSLTHITDQGLQEIRSLTNIVELNLNSAEYVTDEGMAAVKDWKKLRKLNLHGTKVSDTTLEHISGIRTLESLNVGSTMLTDVGLERLTTLPSLHELTMGGTELGDAGLQALRQMATLTYLDLSGRQGTDKNVWTIAITESGLDAVLALRNLRELRFGCSSVGVGIEGAKFAEVSTLNLTSKWLEKMQNLPKLERLKLQGCTRIGDDAVKLLLGMPSLKEVDLKGTSVSEKGVAALHAGRPSLTVYSGAWTAKAANFRNN